MSNTSIRDFTTPVGRVVQGSIYDPQTKDLDNNPLTDRNGNPSVRYFFAVAIPKSDPGWPAIWQTLVAAAHEGFPGIVDASGNHTVPFAFKVVDGDDTTPNRRGGVPADQEGFAGHWIIRFSSGYPPTCYNRNNQQIEPTEIKRGDYVQVHGNCRPNGQKNQPGIYVNHSMVRLVGHGEEIKGGKSAEEAFGAAPATLPTGASATPVAPANSMPAASGGVQPANDFLTPPPPQEEAPAPPPPPAPAAEVKYLVQGKAYSKAALLKGGYSEAQIAALPVSE